MSDENNNAKTQNILWWIASIATSVLCCSILFVLFASYIVDIKTTLMETSGRVNIIQVREERILAEIEMIRKKMGKEGVEAKAPDSLPVGAQGAGAPAVAPTDKVPAVGQDKVPEITPPAAPTPLTPQAAPASAPIPTTVGTTVPVAAPVALVPASAPVVAAPAIAPAPVAPAAVAPSSAVKK